MSASNPSDDQQTGRLAQRTREVFDASVASHDARTRSRLNQARHAALEAGSGHAARWRVNWLVPVGSVAALTLVALASMQFMRSEQVVQEQPIASAVDELEILTSGDELEMLQDVEFYAWLETEPEDVASTHSSETG